MTTLSLPACGLFFFKNQSDNTIRQKITIESFLEFSKANPDEKYELIDGQIIPMSNASPNHGKIITHFSRIIPNHLRENKSSCFYFSDMACKIDAFTCPHPDIVVVCNDSVDRDLLENPTLVGEVHSPSTRKHDFEKLMRYKKCASIQEILMIEQDKMQVTLYQRYDVEWIEKIHSEHDIIHLNSIQLHIAVAELYERVTFNKK